jgi:hypothetical protein
MIFAVALTTQNMEWALFLTQYLGSVGVQEVSSPEALRTSVTSVWSNETARRCVPEGSHIQFNFGL